MLFDQSFFFSHAVISFQYYTRREEKKCVPTEYNIIGVFLINASNIYV